MLIKNICKHRQTDTHTQTHTHTHTHNNTSESIFPIYFSKSADMMMISLPLDLITLHGLDEFGNRVTRRSAGMSLVAGGLYSFMM